MKKEKVLVQCVVNGEEVAEYVDPRESLLDMLRNHLGLTSVKKGCEVGECGWRSTDPQYRNDWRKYL